MHPREYTERVLVGVLLNDPLRVTGIAGWLWPQDFYRPSYGAVYRHLREMVADAYNRDRATEPVHAAHTLRRPSHVVAVQRQPFTEEQFNQLARRASEQEAAASREDSTRPIAPNAGLITTSTVRVPSGTASDALHAAAEHALHGQLASRHDEPGELLVALHARLQASTEPGDAHIDGTELHSLMATAPPPAKAQPERYAQLVLESSIRRSVAEQGIRIQQATRTEDPELVGLLGLVDQALNHVRGLDTRRRQIPDGTRPLLHTLGPSEHPAPPHTPQAPPQQPDAAGAADQPDLFVADTAGQETSDSAEEQETEGAEAAPESLPVPNAQELQRAEEVLLGIIVQQPDTLDRLRLRPADFQDRALGNAFRAAQAIRERETADPHGERVDVVTVVWQQQRQQGQPLGDDDRKVRSGADPERLHSLYADPQAVPGTEHHWEDIVLRGAIARAIDKAADCMRVVAEHPGIAIDAVPPMALEPLRNVRQDAERVLPRPPGEITHARLDHLRSRARHAGQHTPVAATSSPRATDPPEQLPGEHAHGDCEPEV